MSDEKWTKGPWKLEILLDMVTERGRKPGKVEFLTNDDSPIGIWNGSRPVTIEDEANAQLISTAPELYRRLVVAASHECENTCSYGSNGTIHTDSCRRNNEVLARARGEE